MPVEVYELRDTPNEEIMNMIRSQASPDYLARIPDVTKANMSEAIDTLGSHRSLMNEFTDALVNRIGSVIGRSAVWSNPLAPFKQGMMQYGATIEEYMVGLIQAQPYDSDRESMERDLFGTHTPAVQSSFHKVNRREKYPVTVRDVDLKRAFLNDTGLSAMTTRIMQSPTTSDQWDEFTLTTRLFAEYERNGGFYKVNVPDVKALASNEGDAKAALRKMRAMADKLTFMSSLYNSAHMATFAQRDDLYIFCSPDFKAAVDVEALAGAFNIEHANMYGRIITIPEENFGIDGCQAIMTTRDFFVIADTLLENTSLWNPSQLQTNYWLHHQGILSVSRFIPAVMFWTGKDSETIEIAPKPTGISDIVVKNRKNETMTDLVRGELYNLSATVTTDTEGSELGKGVQWEVTGNDSARTRVTQNGVLHVGMDERNAKIKITAKTVTTDSDNVQTEQYLTHKEVNVTGVMGPNWPANNSVTGVLVKGLLVTPLEEGASVPGPELAADPAKADVQVFLNAAYSELVPVVTVTTATKTIKVVVGPDTYEIVYTLSA